MKTRVQSEAGFGLIELMIAMVVLNIGIMAMIASFNSGIVSLARASHISTAAALADQQMERYRGLPYGCIYLTSAGIPSSGLYVTSGTAEGMYSASQVTTPQPSGATCPSPDSTATTAKRLLAGPDHHNYEIDTYIVNFVATVSPASRTELKVTVAVRDVASGHTWARQQSTFDQSTGA